MDVSEDVPARIEALADLIDAPPEWRVAMRTAPRHLFAPPAVLAAVDGGAALIDRSVEPGAWWDAVYSNTALVTQLDGGDTDLAAGAGDYTSSCSEPGVVLAFLRLLRVFEHDRVLEVGTGTGWTAGLLSARLGAENVTSIEVDPAVASAARVNLDAAGFAPHLIVDDGADGWPDGAPYDRVHATAAVRDVPHAWVEQTRPGGVIVTPWRPGIGYGYQLRLDVQRDGTAIGRVEGLAGFMMLRAQSTAHLTSSGEPEESVTDMDPRVIAWDSYGLDLALSAHLPGVVSREEKRDDGTYLFWLGAVDGRSWASVEYVPGKGPYRVLQAGPCRLWDEALDAWGRWQSWGRPGSDRFGLTVTAERQYVWLDSPDHPIWPRTHES